MKIKATSSFTDGFLKAWQRVIFSLVLTRRGKLESPLAHLDTARTRRMGAAHVDTEQMHIDPTDELRLHRRHHAGRQSTHRSR